LPDHHIDFHTMSQSAIVTGDIVLDCHLYGGIKTAATSFSEPGTQYHVHLGGAQLNWELLSAAAAARCATWRQKNAAWETANAKPAKENEELAKEKKPQLDDVLRPADLEESRPDEKIFLGLDAEELQSNLPRHLHSFGVWTPHPARKGSKDLVWRTQTHFGYGEPDSAIATAPPVFKKPKPNALPTDPDLVLIDDGGILFRQQASRPAWPSFSSSGGSKPFLILKTSSPLCRGDLWPDLKAAAANDRLLVLVSVDDLRREDTQISRRLSWEHCVSSTLRAFHEDAVARELLCAAHLVINFDSAGALWLRRTGNDSRARLIFDPTQIEGDFGQSFEGTVYGFQTCIAAAIAHHWLGARGKSSPAEDPIEQGIISGLTARRRLLELGHGSVGGNKSPGFPIEEIGQIIDEKAGGFVSVDVPPDAYRMSQFPWSILTESQCTSSDGQMSPLIGLAQLAARHGRSALSHVPCLDLGKLFSVDRSEIESLRTLEQLIRTYEREKVQEKPLSIGVFGPPGAGKSFAVKALNKAIFGKDAKLLEFNLSQFKDTDDLIGAFHRVRDEVLKGVTPVAFWDEFDSQSYKWLQYLLAPMQDGAFQQGEITHPIGKCIFIFAGGTSPTLGAFGVKEPPVLSPDKRKKLGELEKRKRHAPLTGKLERREAENAWRDFRLLKGPDFISRLHGHLNVLGPNPSTDSSGFDVTWPIRRALMLRSTLGLDEKDELQMDPGLLYALLRVEKYTHGSRSFEKIINALKQDRPNTRLHRSSLPPDPLLDRETNAERFHELMNQRNAFKTHSSIEAIAAAVHQSFLNGKAEADLAAEVSGNPSAKWVIHPAIEKVYQDLSDDAKAANRAAARRVPDHLSLIDFTVVPRSKKDDDGWQKPLNLAIERHLETLAQAEHLGWCAERMANGWTFGKVRDNNGKLHPLLVEWARLSETDREKDRNSARGIPKVLAAAGFKAVRRQ
jgi:hypothetical protein